MALAIIGNDDDFSPAWWRDRLMKHLYDPIGLHRFWYSYYHGTYPPPKVHGKYGEAYELLLAESRHAWGKLIIDTVIERLEVIGIRDDRDEASVDEVEMALAMRATDFKKQSRVVHLDCLTTGYGYASVLPYQDTMRIRAEASDQTIVETDPDTGESIAALKAWWSDWEGEWRATLWLPNGTYRWKTQKGRDHWERQSSRAKQAEMLAEGNTWDDKEVEVAPAVMPGTVPIYEFVNTPDVYGDGHSDLEPVLSIMKRIDRLSLDLLLAAETAAFRQKWATGLVVPTDETGQPVEPFNVAMDKLWISDDPNTKFGSFESTQLEGYIKAISESVAQLAAISRVPAHYLLSHNLVNPPSSEALDASEAGLVKKVQSAQDWFDDQWRHVIGAWQGASYDSFSLQWKDPQRHSLASTADAALKYSQVGLPRKAVWSNIGATAVEIEQWERELRRQKTQDALLFQQLQPEQPDEQDQEGGNQPPPQADADPDGT